MDSNIEALRIDSDRMPHMKNNRNTKPLIMNWHFVDEFPTRDSDMKRIHVIINLSRITGHRRFYDFQWI